MNYQGTLNRVDTSKALALLNLEGNQQGACIKYQCHKCGKQAVIKAYREKKNFCNNEFSAYSDKFLSEAIAPMQNNVGQFLSSSLMRNIIGQKKSVHKSYVFWTHLW